VLTLLRSHKQQHHQQDQAAFLLRTHQQQLQQQQEEGSSSQNLAQVALCSAYLASGREATAAAAGMEGPDSQQLGQAQTLQQRIPLVRAAQPQQLVYQPLQQHLQQQRLRRQQGWARGHSTACHCSSGQGEATSQHHHHQKQQQQQQQTMARVRYVQLQARGGGLSMLLLLVLLHLRPPMYQQQRQRRRQQRQVVAHQTLVCLIQLRRQRRRCPV
jgi:hypothetical protein